MRLRRLAAAAILAAGPLANSALSGEVRYANESAALLPGARLQGMAGVSLGMPGDPTFLLSSPAGLTDISRPEIIFHHASLYGSLDVTQDELIGTLPIQPGVVSGFALTRVGASGILVVDEGEVPDFSNPRTMSAADWTLAAGLARNFWHDRVSVGGVLRILYRELDQTGIGAEFQGSAIYRPTPAWRLGARLDRGIGSVVRWENGRTEYSPSELQLGVGYEQALPYFYGTGAVAWETPGLLHGQASNSFTERDARPHKDFGAFLRASRLGGEFRFDWGGSIRAGAELQALANLGAFVRGDDEQGFDGDARGSLSAGAGFAWKASTHIDYAIMSHPDLGVSHRVSLGWAFGSPLESRDKDKATQRPRGNSVETLDQDEFWADEDGAPLDSITDEPIETEEGQPSRSVAPVSTPAAAPAAAPAVVPSAPAAPAAAAATPAASTPTTPAAAAPAEPAAPASAPAAAAPAAPEAAPASADVGPAAPTASAPTSVVPAAAVAPAPTTATAPQPSTTPAPAKTAPAKSPVVEETIETLE